jgi:hypothetical protein
MIHHNYQYDYYKNRYLSYKRILSKYPLLDLISNISKIELEIIANIKSTIIDYFDSNLFEYQDEKFFKNQKVYKIIQDYTLENRELRIIIRRILGPDNLINQIAKINLVGKIRIIDFSFPTDDINLFEPLVNLISSQIKAAYIALEEVFLNHYKDLSQKVFKTLYEYFDVSLKINEKEFLLGKYLFFITDTNKGYYFINDNVLSKLLEHYKKNQRNDASPLEYSIWIFSSFLPFNKSLTKASKLKMGPIPEKTLTLQYVKEATEILQAEYGFFGEDVTVYTLSETRDQILSIAYSTELAKQIEPEIEFNKETIKIEFEENYKSWSPYIKMIERIHIESKIDRNYEFRKSLGIILGAAMDYTFKTQVLPLIRNGD